MEEASRAAAAARNAGANGAGGQGSQGDPGTQGGTEPEQPAAPITAGPAGTPTPAPAGGPAIAVPMPNGAAPAGAAAPGAPGNPAAPAAAPAFDPNDPNAVLTFDFTDPVDLMQLLDWVSRQLKISFIPDESLQNQRVVFKGPMKIKAGDVLNLLARVLEERGFVLSKDPLGVYIVKPSANTPIVLAGPGTELATTKIIPTPMVRPSTIQTALQAVLTGSGGAPGGPGGPKMTAIDDIGVVVVTGSPSTIRTVEQLIESITAQLGKQTLHRFPLNNVAADFALNRILQLNGKAIGNLSGLGNPAAQPNAAAAGGINGALTQLDSRLFVAPGNAIVFRGPDAEAEEVHKLIELVDVVSSLIAKRYQTGSVTQEIAVAGERMGLGPITQASSGMSAPFGGGGFRAGNNSGAAAGQQQDLPGSGFTVDSERGSIIYYGTESQQAIVAQLVKTFTEQATSDDDVIKVYKLVYAKASGGSTKEGGSSGRGVADVLRDLLQNSSNQSAQSAFLPQRSQVNRNASPLVTPRPAEPATQIKSGGSSEDGTALSEAAQSAIVVADDDRNQILVKAPGPVQKQIGRIIEQLDQRQPQVYIDAKIIAVQLDNQINWSADIQIDAGAFAFLSSFGLTAPITGAAFDKQRGIPAPAQGRSGVTAAVLHQGNFLGVINALQTVAHGRVISSPKILVNDNQKGEQKSLREEPYSATQVSAGNPTITSQGGVADAGTKLTVTPTISKNGDIILDYEIELSTFDQASANSSSGLQPPKQTENYKSKVTVPAESTIVVGGFTLETNQNAENKVPVLGDIPILGMFFKNISNVSKRSMIFVFITPRVLNDPAGADLRILTEGPSQEIGLDSMQPQMDDAEQIPIGPSVGSNAGVSDDPMLDPSLEPIEPPELEPAPVTAPPPAQKPKPVAAANPRH